jgi:hypothetical protein
MARLPRNLCVGVLGIVLTATLAWAQATAQLSGTVTDESGAVLPGVTVTVTQTDTGFTRTAVTETSGAYVMPNLPTGPYRLEISLQGFKSYVQTGIVLQVAASPVINAVLGVGNLEETVAVEAAAPLVDVRSAGIGAVIENERILELPLNGRNATDLVLMAGAAVQTGTPPNHHFQGGVNISVAGGQVFGVAYLLDGALHNDVQNSGGLPLPFPDALQEFRVATSGLSAENGMRSGAEVNAVTKSGTNNFHGNAFEFNRDHQFNATSRFAPIGSNGKRKDDGLVRNQYGGTLGGPVIKDKLFFFGGFQGTNTSQAANDNVTFVPTPAMLAGDFSAFASAACNGGRPLALRAPIVNNRVDPALFSRAALTLAKLLPAAINECGETRFVTSGAGATRRQPQIVTRIDYQRNANHALFGRYMVTFDKLGIPETDNVLAAQNSTNVGLDNIAVSSAFGDNRVLNSNTVNAIRVTYNRTNVDRYNTGSVEPKDLGIPMYAYEPHRMNVSVTGAFSFGSNAGYGLTHTHAVQVGDDLTLVRGNHQIALGVTTAYWKTFIETCARCGGQFNFTGQFTGSGLADYLLGSLSVMEHGGPGGVDPAVHYLGLYTSDAWRVGERVTLNGGIRWEPYFGQQIQKRGIPIWSWDNFKNGVVSQQFVNAPPGFVYAGDTGYPKGTSGMKTQWWNLAPRGGIAWDLTGDGRTSVRSSYGIAYDFPVSDFLFLQTSAPPFGNRLRLNTPPFDNPYRDFGGDPNPVVTNRNTVYPVGGAFGVMKPDINSPRVQSWNVSVERQLGSDWAVQANYLGSHTDRLWNLVPLNPAVYMGTGACTINGVAYPVCSTVANTEARRVITLQNPKIGALISNLEVFQDYGSANYRGLRLAFQRRATGGLSLNGNYTISRCFGDEMTPNQNQFASGPTNPDNLKFDQGNCGFNRTHIANFTVGVETPRFGAAALRAAASGWRVSGIITASSGSWLNVTTSNDVALNGQLSQRVNQISDDVYGAKNLTTYLNAAAFSAPAPGTFGNYVRNSIVGPARWNVDVSLSRNVTFAMNHTLELRLESFNLLNHFNWGSPATNIAQGTFGRITAQANPSRIMQFGVKYGF